MGPFGTLTASSRASLICPYGRGSPVAQARQDVSEVGSAAMLTSLLKIFPPGLAKPLAITVRHLAKRSAETFATVGETQMKWADMKCQPCV